MTRRMTIPNGAQRRTNNSFATTLQKIRFTIPSADRQTPTCLYSSLFIVVLGLCRRQSFFHDFRGDEGSEFEMWKHWEFWPDQFGQCLPLGHRPNQFTSVLFTEVLSPSPTN